MRRYEICIFLGWRRILPQIGVNLIIIETASRAAKFGQGELYLRFTMAQVIPDIDVSIRLIPLPLRALRNASSQSHTYVYGARGARPEIVV